MNSQEEMQREETLDPGDWDSMRALGHRIVDDAMDYLETLRERPVWQHAPGSVKAHFEGPPPAGPMPPGEVYEEYLRYILPHQLGNAHPRYWGWVTGSGTVMGMYAEMLAAATDAVSGAFSYMSNNYVEQQVLDWCKDLLSYPGPQAVFLRAAAPHRTSSASRLRGTRWRDMTCGGREWQTLHPV